MSLRFRVSTSALSVAAMFTGISALLWGQASQADVPKSRTASKAATAWTMHRTPGGHPDLQGYWTNSTYTPLERPAALGTKEFYTEAEESELVRRLRLQDNSQPKDDIHYDNRTWQDESYAKGISNHRTSLIFDPPDGRLPPLNAKGQRHAAEFAQGDLRRKAAVSAKSMSLAERCITWGTEGPPMINSTYNANLQICSAPPCGSSMPAGSWMYSGPRRPGRNAAGRPSLDVRRAPPSDVPTLGNPSGGFSDEILVQLDDPGRKASLGARAAAR